MSARRSGSPTRPLRSARVMAHSLSSQPSVFSSVTGIGSGYQTIGGGPRNSLLFYSLELYRQAFSYLKMGYACAMAIVLFIIVLIVSMVVMWMMERKISYDVE